MMRRLRILGHRLRSLFSRSRQEDDLAREMDLHLKQLIRQLIADGMSPRDAELEAKRQFGPLELTKEHCRDTRRVSVAEDLFRDIAFGLRLFRKSPGFTFTAIMSLGLGIGANAAIFQVFDAVRLRTLPVERPEELMAIRITGEGRSGNFRGRNSQFTNAVWQEVERRQSAFAGVLAYGDTPVNLAPTGEMRNVEGLWVSGSFFPVLGVRPQLGRLLAPHDDRPGCGWPGVVISHAFWQREFGGDLGVLSRKLPINGQMVPILGITPPSFFGVEVGRRFDVAMPICSAAAADLSNRMFWFLSVLGRLKPGVSAVTARADLASLSSGVFEATVPPYQPHDQALYAKLRLDLEPGAAGQSGFRGNFEQPLTFLLAMVTLVLLLACANLANMLLARATAREHEFVVRRSLGASRWRLIRQVLIESLILAVAGATTGVLAAPIVSQMLVNMLSTAREPIFLALDSNWRVLAFTIAAALTATLLFGMAPALRAGRNDTRGASASREKFAFRKALLVAQIALCAVLLTASLLFAQSFRNLLTTNMGFAPQGVLVTNTFFNANQYPPERRTPAIEDLHRRLAEIPGVSGVARSYVIPISGSGWDRGARVNPTDPPHEVDLTSISDGYFRVMNIPLLAGRDFQPTDRPTTPRVAIVNQAFANTFFAGQNPVGRTFRLDGPEPPFEIVGLTGNTKYSALSEVFGPIAYVAASQEQTPRLTVRYLIRSNAPPQALLHSVKQAISSFDPQLSMRFVILESQIQESVLTERLMATLTTAFGGLGMLLALTGIFGVTAYVVARRYREFGVRIALGATGGSIVRMVLSDLGVVLLAGLSLGGILILAGGKLASTLLFGVQATDGATILAVTALISIGGLVASLIPAVRAANVAPSEALRVD